MAQVAGVGEVEITLVAASAWHVSVELRGGGDRCTHGMVCSLHVCSLLLSTVVLAEGVHLLNAYQERSMDDQVEEQSRVE